MLKEDIDKALKVAMLARETEVVDTLKGLKSAILYEEVQKGQREQGLDEEQIQAVLRREAKKRAESADLYEKAGETERAAKESSEKALIETFLPAAMSEEDLSTLIDEQITLVGASTVQDMGKVIGAVKVASSGTADGALTAKLVKEKLGAS